MTRLDDSHESRPDATAGLGLLEYKRLAVVGSLTAKLVHNLNNPLTLLKANVAHVAQCLEDGQASGELADLGSELIAEMQHALEDIRGVLSAVGEYAAADADVSDVDLVECVDTGVAVAGIRARFGAELRFEPPADAVLVRGRRQQLQQLVTALLLHATAQPASYGVVTIDVRREGPSAVLEVTDRRPLGIATHVPEGSHPDQTDPEVGLLFARYITADHGGTITHDATADAAPVYRVSLPVCS